jgi:hypothetical protein
MTSNRIPCPDRQVLFALLSLADLTLTWWLLGHSGGAVYEANPVARWWLTHCGWAGFVCFKVAVVLLVLALAVLIARSRPRAAGRLLGLGCLSLSLVVLYSASLCRAAARTPEERAAEVTQETEKALAAANRETLQEIHKLQARSALRARLCADLLAGRCSLREGVARVVALEQAPTTTWQKGLAARFPDLAPEARVAVWLIEKALDTQENAPEQARHSALRLAQEFQHTYGQPLPAASRAVLPGAESAEEAGPLQTR